MAAPHLDLQLHDVPARGRPHQPRAHLGALGVELSHVARVLVVVDHLLVVAAADRGGDRGRQAGKASAARGGGGRGVGQGAAEEGGGHDGDGGG